MQKVILKINPNDAEYINNLCTIEPQAECFSEDDTIIYTATFPNDYAMDIKCCGVQYEEGGSNTAWTEAVLFKHGSEVCHSEVCDYILGDWELEAEGRTFIVTVVTDDTVETGSCIQALFDESNICKMLIRSDMRINLIIRRLESIGLLVEPTTNPNSIASLLYATMSDIQEAAFSMYGLKIDDTLASQYADFEPLSTSDLDGKATEALSFLQAQSK